MLSVMGLIHWTQLTYLSYATVLLRHHHAADERPQYFPDDYIVMHQDTD